jgi:hypothetical protein
MKAQLFFQQWEMRKVEMEERSELGKDLVIFEITEKMCT